MLAAIILEVMDKSEPDSFEGDDFDDWRHPARVLFHQ